MKILGFYFLIISIAVLVNSKAVEETTTDETNLPKFNLASGFYNKKTIKLEITNADPNAVIYYTLDGSIPTLNSTLYEKPVVLKNRSEEENVLSSITGVSPDRDYVPKVKVKKGNVIRAMAKLSNGTLTDVVSSTYFVGLNRKKLSNNLPVVSIITDPDNLFGYENGIYIKGKRYDDWIAEDPENINALDYLIEGNYNYKGKESERPATLQYFPGNKNVEGFSQDFGIRIMGKATRTYVQKSFRFVSREEYGKKNLKYDLIPGNMRSDGNGPLTKYKSFNLRNGGNDFDYSKIRDNVLQNLVSNRSFETQQNDFAVAFIDGEYWGVYSIYEDYSDNYIANNYDIDKDNVIIIKNQNKVEAGMDSDADLLKENLESIFAKDMSLPENYEEGKKLLMWKNLPDGPFGGGNFAFWRVRNPDASVPKADGKWRILTYDTEFSSGIYPDISKYDDDLLSSILTENQWFSGTYCTNLLNTFLKNKEFKNLFINALSDIRNIDFDLKRLNSTIEKMRKTLSPLMKDHYDRFGTMKEFIEDGYRHFDIQVDLFKTWLNNKHSIFMKEIERDFELQPPVTVTITSDNFRKGSFVVNDGWKIFDKKYKGEYFRENILYITAKPSSGRKLKYWKIKNCTFANETGVHSSSKYQSSSQTTIGIYPDTGCKITVYFK
ncbi:hypothetical protein PIROE2DRAFT_7042 [Piromyces sp. E2]|nr:hypothetical protein PIROE2DRAFT_7042 [Piromyces sp. E2]|eukprot:OUM65882.1 hypothetical protein PIROE2DRAFT_7042 [Piromyces sp. E2]